MSKIWRRYVYNVMWKALVAHKESGNNQEKQRPSIQWTETYLEPSQTSVMGPLVEIVNGF